MPTYRYSQADITAALKHHWNGKLERPELLDRLHSRTGVEFRNLASPLERSARFRSWGETNAAWLEVAQTLGENAIDTALDRAGIERDELDALFVVSITGIASPSLDARLINRMRLRPDIKRTPIFGVGCVGGAIGLTLGIVFGAVPALSRLMEVTIEAIRPIPSIALLPIALTACLRGWSLA